MKKGDPVTVVFLPAQRGRPHVLRAEVTVVHESIGGFVCDPLFDPPFNRKFGDPVIGRLFVEEGITWCRGWEGPAVDALRSAEALT